VPFIVNDCSWRTLFVDKDNQSSETAYAITYPTLGFSATLADLDDGGTSPRVASSSQACLIDSILASGRKSDYVFTWIGDGLAPSVSYTINGDPTARGSSGRRSFFTNYPGVIRYNDAAPATVSDPTI